MIFRDMTIIYGNEQENDKQGGSLNNLGFENFNSKQTQKS